MPEPLVSTCRGSVRISTKIFTALLVVIAVGATILSLYALSVRTQAESLLKDLTSLAVGSSTESDVEQLTRKHARYWVFTDSNKDVSTTVFTIQNTWLSALHLEPVALFGVSVSVKDRQVSKISAWQMRSMDIYPTFGASAGMVDEYAEYPAWHLSRGGHFQFPTPVGKPYLRVEIDSHVSPIQRQHAFAFSFRCLTKVGWGCDLPCDYLPLAWRDWRADLQERGASEMFQRYYPNNARCKE